jgi:16S rRNA (cytosine967-C5)-methyltransferase
VFKWLNVKPETTIRVNLQKITRVDLKKELETLGFETYETELSPAGLIFSDNVPNMTQSELYKKGFFEFQDEASQLSTLLVKNTCKTFYEPCAGAGGKSLAVQSFFPKTKITNSDIRTNLFKEIQSRGDRAGAKIEIINLEKSLKRSFNTVFVDSPCSGSGVLRRNPGDRWTISEKLIRKLNETQKEILVASSKRVRDGGELIYITCSFLKEENEAIVENFLENNPKFELVSASERFLENIGDKDLTSIVDGMFFKTAPLFSRDIMFGAILKKV